MNSPGRHQQRKVPLLPEENHPQSEPEIKINEKKLEYRQLVQ